MYDLIIIGGGPAGLTAAIYAARYKLKTIVISKTRGGLAASAHAICNYPSYDRIDGLNLMEKFIKQVEELKVPIIYEEVGKIDKSENKFTVKTKENIFESKKVILAGGTERTKLNVKGEKEFIGRGVSYCATCDAPFFKNKITAVAGGGNAALTSALLLSEFSSKVYIIVRSKFRAEPSWIELVEKNSKIEPLLKEEIVEITGNEKVEKIKLKSGKELDVDGIFIEIGSVPDTNFVSNLRLEASERGYIITDENQETNIDGLYAAGDITESSLKQIVTAASQGAVASFSVYEKIKKQAVEIDSKTYNKT
ncbi:FAD-binding protein [Candidatus Pacearchaeota archaeon]|nr:FAD-binding protein [Candidatus Pacearchaeota archaeon]MBD3283234.1 FAD-binding protein [Candidatus Pacearchaeota archaeon]